MALPLNNTFESGETPGTAITTGNSGGGAGDAWDTVTLSGAGALVYQTDQVAHGSLSAKLTTGAGGFAYADWTTAMGGSQTELWFRTYLRINAIHTSGEWRLVTGAGRFLVLADRTLRVLPADFSGSSTTALALALDTWYRVEGHMFANATTGSMEVRAYVGDSETLYTSASVSDRNNGTSISGVSIGGAQVNTAGLIAWIDSIQLNNTGWPGPLTAPSDATLHVVQSGLRW